MSLANRVKNIKPSFTLQMATKAAEMRSKGIDVINFSVGEPDFNTPKHIRDSAKDALDRGYTKYTAGPGMIEFREAICTKLKRENGIFYKPSDILVSNGEKQSLFTACQALFNPGDSVIIFSPYWVSFPEFVKMADAKPILVDTLPDNNFEPDFSDLKSKISSKIKGVIIKAMSKIQGQATSCANSIGQKAGITALLGDQSCVEEMKNAFLKRRDLMVELLNDTPGIKCAKPSGAFYAFPDFSAYLNRKGNNKLLKDTFDISEYILDSVQVVTVPGDGFGASGHIRFSYATNREIIKEGIDRVRKSLHMIEE